MDRRLIWLVCVALGSGCVIKSSDGSEEAAGGSGGTAASGGSGGTSGAGGSITGQGGGAADTLDSRQSGYLGATRQVQVSWLAAIDAASDGFTISLTTQPASEAGLDAFDTALDDCWVSAQQQLVAAHDLVLAYEPVFGMAGMSQSQGSQSAGIGVQRQPVVLEAIFVAGLVYAGYGFLRSLGNAMDTRANATRAQIENATPQELAVINDELGLDPAATNQQALEAFNALSDGQRNVARGRIEDQLDSLEAPDFTEVDARRRATAEAAVELGEAGVKMTADTLATAAGGQGMGEALQGAGMSEVGAAVVDLAVTVTEWQPLDLLNEHVNVTTITQSGETLSVTDVGDLSLDDARVLLGSAQDDDLGAATELVLDTVGRQEGGETPQTATIVIPDATHVETIGWDGQSTSSHLDVFGDALVDALLTGDFFSPLGTTFDADASNPEIFITPRDAGSGGSGGAGTGGAGGSAGSSGSGGSGGGDGYVLLNVTNFGAQEGYWAVRLQSSLTPTPTLNTLACGGLSDTPWEYTIHAGPFPTAEEAAAALCPRVKGFYLAPLAPPECVSVFIDAEGWPDHAGGRDTIIQTVCEPLL
ncbi:MAG: hypothetical protein AB7K71_11670 [Polyangiaceae bacterium]